MIEESDLNLPFRTQKSAHKGTYGHTAVLACQKDGAAILAATAAMDFGSGLTSIVKTNFSKLSQFKISPELMISDEIPEKTTCLIFGPGFCYEESCNEKPNSKTKNEDVEKLFSQVLAWFENAKNPAIVLDAGILTFEKIIPFLLQLNRRKNAKIILTPHLQEFSKFLQKTKDFFPDFPFENEDFSVKNLAENANKKIEIGKKLVQIFENTTIVIKSANSFIASKDEDSKSAVFICNEGCQSLAKGGSGDVLAGMTGSLLAQGYCAKDAAVCAVLAHAIASKKLGEKSYSLTPLKLCKAVSSLESN